MRNLNSKPCSFLIWILVIVAPDLFADDRIRIYYNERPPYLVTVSEGVVSGLTADPVRNAFQQAGIPSYWRRLPSKRQMIILQQNKGKDCLVGWFKNPEREKFARFTKPIYQNRPTIALALFSNTKIESGGDFRKSP